MELSLLDIYNQMGNFAKGIVYVLALMSIDPFHRHQEMVGPEEGAG